MKKNEVMSNNAFVKAEQNKMRAKMGDRPGCPPAMKKFDAYMSNDGEDAQAYARKLNMDDAFPIK